MHENDPKYDPWKSSLDAIDNNFDPLSEQKEQLLREFPVNDSDRPSIDIFFEALQALEEVWKATGALDREKLRVNTLTLFEVPQQLAAVNPRLSEKLDQMREDHVQRLNTEAKKAERESVNSMVETMRFGLVADNALKILEQKYPGIIPQEGLLPLEVRGEVERIIRPHYDKVNRSYQDIPTEGTTKLSRFNTFFWTLNHSEMIEELRTVFAQ